MEKELRGAGVALRASPGVKNWDLKGQWSCRSPPPQPSVPGLPSAWYPVGPWQVHFPGQWPTERSSSRSLSKYLLSIYSELALCRVLETKR